MTANVRIRLLATVYCNPKRSAPSTSRPWPFRDAHPVVKHRNALRACSQLRSNKEAFSLSPFQFTL